MARGLRSKPSNNPTEDTSTEKSYDIPGLDFHQTLAWRPGKAIPIADLLGRLKDLRDKLSQFEDDQVDSRLWTGLSNDLANGNLLGHKDKGVRAYTAACVIDVLKICAPDAPFQTYQLKDIFNVLINSILPALADPTNAYNPQHVYVLQSLSDSQSILLLADVEDPEALISALFTNAFDIFAESSSGRDVEISKTVEYHLKNLLGLVIDEVDVPQDVTDIIISQFMRVAARKQTEPMSKSRKSDAQDVSQSTLQLKEYPVAYNIAKSICTTCLDKMTAQVTHYFNAVIVDAGGITDQPDQTKDRRGHAADVDDVDDQYADLRKAHRLIRELWRACPDVIINVIPQVEAELQADSVHLRRIATETLGDIAAGIGIAGFAPSASIDPAAYPQLSIEDEETTSTQVNPLLNPASPKPFAAIHKVPYQNFLGRRHDRSPSVREAWAEAASRILSTRAGAIGMSDDDQAELLAAYAQALRDPDEHVRLTALRSLSKFNYHGVINILAADGGLANPTSVLCALAERISDRKLTVRESAIDLAARIWGAASYDIQQGNATVQSAVGDLASRLLNAYYTKDDHLHTALERVLFEALIPISFPSMKGNQAGKRKTKAQDSSSSETPDAVRALRILTLVNSLDEKARRILLGLQGRQSQISRGVKFFLDACESFNGGVVDDEDGEAKIQSKLATCIDSLCKPFYDSPRTSADLWKFAKQHDRRNYQLIKFAVSPEFDYKTMSNAVKELFKRIREGPSSTQAILDSLQQLTYRSAVIMYNRSHVPTIMDVARTDEFGLGSTAHAVLREISSKTPEVLKSHINALCAELEQTAPSATSFEEPSAADTLKACAQYARKYPEEVSKERKFLTALTNFALFSRSPRAAKHAVAILLVVTDRKEMYARDILTKGLKDCRPGSTNFLARLAAIGQVCRYAPEVATTELERIRKLVEDVLHENKKPSKASDPAAWDATPSEETQAKEMALRILVNQCRGEDFENSEDFAALSEANYDILFGLIENDGETAPGQDMPPAQRNHLRLTAAKLILKLCVSKRTEFEALTTPARFQTIAWVVIHPPNEVRRGFVSKIRKYYAQNQLAHRWLTILFLLAYEPDDELRTSAISFLRSRTQALERRRQEVKTADRQSESNVIELLFARLLSLLASHPDYPPDDDSFDVELIEYSKYIVFYLVAVASEDNISLIFHIAQRVKQMRNHIGTDDDRSERLYVLSDLAQAVIRNFADTMPHSKGASVLQTWPGKVNLQKSLFRPLLSHTEAQQIAEKNYLPEDTAIGLEKFVKDTIKQLKGVKPTRRPSQLPADKKRKSYSAEPDELSAQPRKKKKSSLPIRKTSKVKKEKARSDASTGEVHEPSRKSGRVSNAISYVEDSSDDNAEDEVMVDVQTASSPAIPKRNGRLRRSSPAEDPRDEPQEANGHDAEMPDAENDVNIHEDSDAAAEEADSDRDGTPSPSPLKERDNTPGPPSPAKKKNMGKQKNKAKAASSAKSTPASTKRKTATPSSASAKKKNTRTSQVMEMEEAEEQKGVAVEENAPSARRSSRRSRG